MRRLKKKYKICGCFDTETTNFIKDDIHEAFVCLYIFSDLSKVGLYDYDLGDEVIHFYRTEEKAIEYIDSVIEYGLNNNIIPIICAYNLMFDLQTLLFDLHKKYEMAVSAQSSTNVYYLDILDISGNTILRFWDTFHLEMRGLAAMGEVCGVPKAKGDWDYTLIRTPETKLTQKERFYASRDVQVIPAYLRYLLHANEWLKEEMFGNRVLTKTSLVRQMAKHDISNLICENGSVGGNFFSCVGRKIRKTMNSMLLEKRVF